MNGGLIQTHVSAVVDNIYIYTVFLPGSFKKTYLKLKIMAYNEAIYMNA